MKRPSEQHRLISTAIILGCTLGIAAPASAQDVPTTEPAGLDGAETGDIIVTARKRDEDIQTVPISITALTAQDLAERNISNLNDLANATPGLAITSISGGTTQNIYLRGVAPANTSTDLNTEANVGVFIDGIYQSSRNTLDIISVLDVGQIEVVKGPQSALFGRSTFAGALSVSTRRPAREFEGAVAATIGQDEDYRIRGTISAPLGGGLYARIGGGYLTYDGFGRNSADVDDRLGGTRKYAVTAALEYAPTDDFTARLAGFLTHSETELSPAYVLPLTSFNCGTTTTSPLVGASAAAPRSQVYCGALTAQKVSSATPDAPDTLAKTRQVSLSIEWRRSGVRAVSLTGYSQAENRAYNDYDGSAAGTLFGVCGAGAGCVAAPNYTRLINVNLLSTGAERVRTFSQEIRLQSDDGSPFEWLIGGSFFNQQIPLAAGGIGADAAGLAANERLVAVNQIGAAAATGGAPNAAYDFTANSFLTPSSLTRQLFSSYTVASTKTFGIFGSIGYGFGGLRINAEGRYNIDRKRAQVFSVSNPLSQPGINQPIAGATVPAAGTFPVIGAPFARTFEHFAPRVTVDYQVTPEIMFYASAAKGYRSGGFNTANPVSATGILAEEAAYGEESNWTYEGGVKSRLFNRRLLLNASVFRVDWSDAQVSAFTNNPTAVNPVRIVRNAGNIRITGFEAQADLTLGDIFGIGGSVVYSDPKFQAGAYDGSQIVQCRLGTTPATFTAAPGCPAIIGVPTANGGTQFVPSLEGLRPQRSVKLQWNGHATVNAPINDQWRLTGRVDVTYTGPAFNNLINTISFGKRTLTSARIGFEGERFGIALWGNNLFDETYVVNSINQPRAGVPFAFSVPEIYLGEGRRLGATATARF